jgi:hypothetical protein
MFYVYVAYSGGNMWMFSDEKAKQLCTDVLEEIKGFFCASITQYENIRKKGFVRLKFYHTSSKV